MDYNDPLRRDGRAVECTGLENQQALIGLPGFESLSLRHYNQPFRRPCTRMYKIVRIFPEPIVLNNSNYIKFPAK